MNIMDTSLEIRKILGTKNVVSIWFHKEDGLWHNESANVECLNPFFYRKFLGKMAKIGTYHVEVTPHWRSLEGSEKPSKYFPKYYIIQIYVYVRIQYIYIYITINTIYYTKCIIQYPKHRMTYEYKIRPLYLSAQIPHPWFRPSPSGCLNWYVSIFSY